MKTTTAISIMTIHRTIAHNIRNSYENESRVCATLARDTSLLLDNREIVGVCRALKGWGYWPSSLFLQ